MLRRLQQPGRTRSQRVRLRSRERLTLTIRAPELQSGSPEVGVDQAPDGSGTITVASTTATLGQDTTGAYLVNAGQPLGNLGFTYTATGKMESGASVSITVPSEGGWDQPTYSNTEVSAGGVTLGIE